MTREQKQKILSTDIDIWYTLFHILIVSSRMRWNCERIAVTRAYAELQNMHLVKKKMEVLKDTNNLWKTGTSLATTVDLWANYFCDISHENIKITDTEA